MKVLCRPKSEPSAPFENKSVNTNQIQSNWCWTCFPQDTQEVNRSPTHSQDLCRSIRFLSLLCPILRNDHGKQQSLPFTLRTNSWRETLTQAVLYRLQSKTQEHRNQSVPAAFVLAACADERTSLHLQVSHSACPLKLYDGQLNWNICVHPCVLLVLDLSLSFFF